MKGEEARRCRRRDDELPPPPPHMFHAVLQPADQMSKARHRCPPRRRSAASAFASAGSRLQRPPRVAQNGRHYASGRTFTLSAVMKIRSAAASAMLVNACGSVCYGRLRSARSSEGSLRQRVVQPAPAPPEWLPSRCRREERYSAAFQRRQRRRAACCRPSSGAWRASAAPCCRRCRFKAFRGTAEGSVACRR